MLRGFADAVGSSLTLTGAIVIGWGLHRTVWLGDLSLTSPAAVASLGGGAVLVAAGLYLEERPPVDETGEEDEEPPEDVEYDERFSPVDAEQLADRDTDDGE